MRRISIAAALLPAILWVACASHNGWEPVELDVSQKKAAAAAPPAPTPTPGIVPAPTVEPAAPVLVPTAAPPAPAPSSARAPSTPEAVARARADAFNRHDLHALA